MNVKYAPLGIIIGMAVVGMLRNSVSAETKDFWDLKYVQGALANVNVTYQNGGSFTTRTVGAGLLKFDPGGDTYYSSDFKQTFPLVGTAFWTYCTDVGVDLYVNNKGDEGNGWDYKPTKFEGQNGVNPIWRDGGVYDAAYIYNKLVEGYASRNPKAPKQPDDKLWGNLNFDPLDANNEYAAAQVAIWEVLYDNNYNLDSGRFKLNTKGKIAEYAAAILAQLQADKANPNFNNPYLTTWLQPMTDLGEEGGSQGLLYPPVVGWTPHPVPDGGMTLVLLGLATGGLAAVGRRLRKK